jgi:hypothetical protein
MTVLKPDHYSTSPGLIMHSTGTREPDTRAVESLLSGLFDYAGLFPPASLTLEEAVYEYRSHLQGPEKWMLGPFVIPVSRLDELESFSTFFEVDRPWQFSCLGSGSTILADLGRNISSDFARIDGFQRKFGPGVRVTMYEVRLPVLDTDNLDDLPTFVGGLRTSDSKSVELVFLEPARTGEFRRDVKALADSIVHAREGDHTELTGLKLRCGGMSRDDFPSAQEVAEFLYQTAVSNIRFKVTAGLHHPVRHFNTGQGVTMHGFLNVFFASAFCAVYELEPADLLPVLLEEDAEAFLFSDDGIRWRDLAVTTAQLAEIRSRLASSIGSCSLTEPRNDLISLGHLH